MSLHLLRIPLLAALMVLGTASHVVAQEGFPENYERPQGAPFFLLTDTSYGSQDEAQVRLEVASHDLSAVSDATGVDMALYRVDDALEFLKRQKNLHRITLAASPRSQDLGNGLAFLWDSAWRKARTYWQTLFAPDLRRRVVQQAPQLATPADMNTGPTYQFGPSYQAPPGMQAERRFRYPVQFAKSIAPPKDLRLAGSSSEFTPRSDGNVMIPLGRQKPGLYVVEAAIGKHRAVALLFVADSVLVSKTSQQQLLAWVAQRSGGAPSVGAQLVWSDLNGVLGSTQTDAHGVATLSRTNPQTSYLFGQDAKGGVFISENFYFDSEIYNNKLYATTDRPLYRPGDEVHIKILGREFQSSTTSKPMASGQLGVQIYDAQGSLIHEGKVNYASDAGGQHRLTLPDNAPAGGYEIRIKRGDDEYSAAFRVAQYVKPHFEILIEPAKTSYKTAEAVEGRIRLAYPDGKPVPNATVDLSARAQLVTMVDGDLAYGGVFPVQLDKNQALVTDGKGIAKFSLPAVKEPSRLMLTVLASDGAAQRVRSTREVLIERSASAWSFKPERQFAAPKTSINWRMAALDATQSGNSPVPSVPIKWRAIHQESQSSTEGALSTGAHSLALSLERPGSYTVQLLDAQGQMLGAGAFWVSGGETKPPEGTIEVVFDKPQYKAGDTAKALISFPVEIHDALLTLERDSVERYGRLQAPGSIGQARKIGPTQWEVALPVQTEFAPNITLSVAYVKGGSFGFQNAGIAIAKPGIELSLKTDKPSYRPGDTVTVDIQTASQGKPVAAVLSLAAVDEMVYVLQPELAPSIQDFFYHPRRNNVRTHSSLAFIGYDEAVNPQSRLPTSRQVQERGIKLLERPRRDERDTAYWNPTIRTDARGQAQISFVVPDALSRWRITARAMGQGTADGLVGEKRAFFMSDKPYYVKWTSPNWQRMGDSPLLSLAVFNQTKVSTSADITVQPEGGTAQKLTLQLEPGANFATVKLPALTGSTQVQAQISIKSAVQDVLQTRLSVLPLAWPNSGQTWMEVQAGQTKVPLKLPPDAADIYLQVQSEGAAAWSQVADGLIDYPYGCVEQTASRLIPLSLALRSQSSPSMLTDPLRQRLFAARLRLASMAGPNAVFGWWGHGTQDSAFMSSYAYYADYMATQTLGITLPAQHWARLTEIYGSRASQESLAHRALALWMMRDMGLPTATFTSGLLADLQKASLQPGTAQPGHSWVLGGDAQAPEQQAVAVLLAAQLARSDGQAWPTALDESLAATKQVLQASNTLFAQAALVMAGVNRVDAPAMQTALEKTAYTDPTIDRALALIWWAKASNLKSNPIALAQNLNLSERTPGSAGALWRESPSATGAQQWHWQGSTPPGELSINAPAAPMSLSVRYSTSVQKAAALPVTVTRRLYRLERTGQEYRRVAVKEGTPLSTTELYLDEVTLDASKPLHYALLEVPLPPGGMMEPSTWGIRLQQADNKASDSAAKTAVVPPSANAAADTGVALERALGQATREGYSVGVDALQGRRVFSHLVRVGQKGQFMLPRARLWRMYQPEARAVEAGSPSQRWTVE